MNDKKHFLDIALKNAKKAKNKAEVPVGAIVVHNEKIIAHGHNLKETKKNPILHAEIVALQKAAKKIGSWRLENCDLYVTLEPCPMCAGAIQQARIRRVIYGATDKKSGVISNNINIHQNKNLNHRYEMELEEHTSCSKILTEFFNELRKRKKEKKKYDFQLK